MKIERIKTVKESKIWRPWDLVIYGAILLVVAVAFIVIAAKNSSNKEIIGVEISYKSEVIGVYTLQGGWLQYAEVATIKITESKDEAVIKITTERGYNELTVKKATGHAYMTSADCSGEDCTKMKIEKSSDVIICVPHGITVKPLSDGETYIPQDITVYNKRTNQSSFF